MRTGDDARTRLLDPAAEVSCHYLVWEDGRVEQMVAEADRAWHAGRSFWAGETDMNAVSIGIEIVNGGHDFGCPPYPAPQMAAVAALAREICARRAIPPHRVLAHSDVAPDRKCDPGEWFPWRQLAAAGVGLWVEPREVPDGAVKNIAAAQHKLVGFGYACPLSGELDGATTDVVRAFQRHYRPERIDGVADAAVLASLDDLLGIRP